MRWAPPALPPASQVPSHLPWQSTVAPTSAEQDPLQVPVQLPSHVRVAPASAVQLPLQETSILPPSQVGGLALTSHSADAEQLADQVRIIRDIL